jgi:hypothetical protein
MPVLATARLQSQWVPSKETSNIGIADSQLLQDAIESHCSRKVLHGLVEMYVASML